MSPTPVPSVDPERYKQFLSAALTTGSHDIVGKGVGCFANWGDYLLGGNGDTDDCPPCASPAIWRACIRLNDRFDAAGKERLKPYLTRTFGTANEALEPRRRWLGVNFLVREFTIPRLERAGLLEHVAALRALPELTAENYDQHLETLRAARRAAWEKRNEVWGPAKAKIKKAVEAELVKKGFAAADAAARGAAHPPRERREGAGLEVAGQGQRGFLVVGGSLLRSR